MSETSVPLLDGTLVNVVDQGQGYPVVFQHGLGGDRHQVADSFPDNVPCRRITVECRGHGLSSHGPRDRYSIGGFAEDVLVVADKLGASRFAVGGISMGAAIALKLAIAYPKRVSALMLVRPAWMTQPAPDNMRPFAEAAQLLRRYGRDGREMFANSPTGRRLSSEAPDNLASLLGFFDRDNPAGLADLLEAIAVDGPGISEIQLRALNIPVLIVGHGQDLVHPLDHARRLAEMIPHAHLAEITPKAVDKTRYTAELRATMGAFLRKYAITEEPAR